MKLKLMLLLGIMIIITFTGAIIITITKPKEDTKTISEGNKQDESAGNFTRHELKVVTTFYPMYLIGLNIAGSIDDIEVSSLTNLKTGCLHDYQLTTQDMKLISDADILVVNGGGMEGFLKDVTENYPNVKIIDASKGITMLDNNPHVWLDPELYIKQIENVRDGFITYINTAYVEGERQAALVRGISQNAQTYIDKVSKLNSDLEDTVHDSEIFSLGNLPKAVIFHDAFAYLAHRSGIPIAFSVPLDSDTSLSADNIAEIIDDVRKDNIRFLFTEKQYSDSIAKQIEAETNAKVYIIDSGVTGNGDKDSYLKAMENNIAVLKEALKH